MKGGGDGVEQQALDVVVAFRAGIQSVFGAEGIEAALETVKQQPVTGETDAVAALVVVVAIGSGGLVAVAGGAGDDIKGRPVGGVGDINFSDGAVNARFGLGESWAALQGKLFGFGKSPAVFSRRPVALLGVSGLGGAWLGNRNG